MDFYEKELAITHDSVKMLPTEFIFGLMELLQSEVDSRNTLTEKKPKVLPKVNLTIVK